MEKSKLKKVIEFIIVLLTAVSSFLGGQAAAQSNTIDIFGKYEQMK
jgi:hypothetical protein